MPACPPARLPACARRRIATISPHACVHLARATPPLTLHRAAPPPPPPPTPRLQNLYEIARIYEETWPLLTDKYYSESPWPAAETISPLVKNDPMFITLYRELYFRHIYARLTPTLAQRNESYENYCDLFNYVVHNNDSPEPVELELPNKWLWDVIDEFIYQFESFAQYRVRLAGKTADDILELKQNPRLWNVHIVLNVLHSLIDKSMINDQLEAYKRGEDPDDFAGEYGSLPLYKMLGYFSLIALLRLHCLLGECVRRRRPRPAPPGLPWPAPPPSPPAPPLAPLPAPYKATFTTFAGMRNVEETSAISPRRWS